MTRTTCASQPRQTLASQLDRLEDLLDQLPATLQSVVSAAVEQAVTQAVQQALPMLLTALLHHPQFLDALLPRAQAATAPAAAVGAAVRKACQRLGNATGAAWQLVRRGCVVRLGQVVQLSHWLAMAGQRLYRCRRRLLWACGMGWATSLVIWWSGPWLGVSVGFLAGFLLTLAVPEWQRLHPLPAKGNDDT